MGVGGDAQRTSPIIHAARSSRRPDRRLPAPERQRRRHVHRGGLDRRRGVHADLRPDHRPRRSEDDQGRPEGLQHARTPRTRYAGFDYFRVDCSDKIAPATTADARQRRAGRQARLVLEVAQARRSRPTTARATAWPRSSTRSTAAPADLRRPVQRRHGRRARDRLLRHRQGRQRREGQEGRVPRRWRRADEHRHGQIDQAAVPANVTIGADDGTGSGSC